ncbi:MAG: VacJ family lipoprotein [Pseudomonadota bacterium]
MPRRLLAFRSTAIGVALTAATLLGSPASAGVTTASFGQVSFLAVMDTPASSASFAVLAQASGPTNEAPEANSANSDIDSEAVKDDVRKEVLPPPPPKAEPTSAATEPARSVGVTSDEDPWEGFNRDMFKVQTFLDDNLLVPAAKTYRAVTPERGRRSLRRFLSNLRSPAVFFNDVLQGEVGRAGKTLSRFVINTTIGAGGLADPAQQMGIAGHNEDFGQTLAVWGIDSGPYVVMPFLGPSTVRDSLALIPQIALDPLNYIRTPPAGYARVSRGGAGIVSGREPLIEPLQDIRESSLDYYSSFRSFYIQARRQQILNGRTDFNALPDFDDLGDFDDFEDFEDFEDIE